MKSYRLATQAEGVCLCFTIRAESEEEALRRGREFMLDLNDGFELDLNDGFELDFDIGAGVDNIQIYSDITTTKLSVIDIQD